MKETKDKPELPAAWSTPGSHDCYIFTTKHVMLGGEPIVYVSHDVPDRSWQFHSAGKKQITEAMLVSLEEIFSLDPTVGAIADLPLGWRAFREAPGKPWTREEKR